MNKEMNEGTGKSKSKEHLLMNELTTKQNKKKTSEVGIQVLLI